MKIHLGKIKFVTTHHVVHPVKMTPNYLPSINTTRSLIKGLNTCYIRTHHSSFVLNLNFVYTRNVVLINKKNPYTTIMISIHVKCRFPFANLMYAFIKNRYESLFLPTHTYNNPNTHTNHISTSWLDLS